MSKAILSRKERLRLARKLGLTLLYDSTGKYVAAHNGGWCVFSGLLENLDWRLRLNTKASA